jgi:hypothetical protein
MCIHRLDVLMQRSPIVILMTTGRQRFDELAKPLVLCLVYLKICHEVERDTIMSSNRAELGVSISLALSPMILQISVLRLY